jgi:hypothetical protein
MKSDTERKRNRKGRRDAAQSNSPPQIVCTGKDATAKNTIEFGVILSGLVICLYLFACMESVMNLPKLSTARHLGVNLNMANLESRVSHDNIQRQVTENVENSSSKLAAPYGTWPVAYKEEVDGQETILHPGDLETKMKVPKFWSSPLHNKQQYTREQAMQVGTCVEPDPETGSHVRGDKCPPGKRTIFIAIASYRDFECRSTVESVFMRAEVCLDSYFTLTTTTFSSFSFSVLYPIFISRLLF